MKQEDYLEIIEQNKSKHRSSLETLIQGRKNNLSYSKPEETRLTCIFNIEDTENQYQLHNPSNNLEIFPIEIEIDGVVVPISELRENYFRYRFSKTGQHVVKYTYEDNTFIPYAAFYDCIGITKVIIPDCVVSIGGQQGYGGWSFNHCTNLIDVVFNKDTLKYIGGGTFCHCPLNEELRQVLIDLYGQSCVECD